MLSWLPTLHVVEVPHLTLASAGRHFARHGVPCPAPAEDRPLAGCFGGHRGVGVILFDPTLEPAELIFTLAHELAHYLRDYDAPRRRKVAARLGRSLSRSARRVAARDGDERLAGLLRGVIGATHTHFLDRNRWGAHSPRRHARRRTPPTGSRTSCSPRSTWSRAARRRTETLARRLVSDFALPPAEAAKYAAILVR